MTYTIRPLPFPSLPTPRQPASHQQESKKRKKEKKEGQPADWSVCLPVRLSVCSRSLPLLRLCAHTHDDTRPMLPDPSRLFLTLFCAVSSCLVLSCPLQHACKREKHACMQHNTTMRQESTSVSSLRPCNQTGKHRQTHSQTHTHTREKQTRPTHRQSPFLPSFFPSFLPLTLIPSQFSIPSHSLFIHQHSRPAIAPFLV